MWMPMDLPEGIIEMIFARLPVKFLLRLKCLSKQWCAIISSPRFAQLQFNNGPCKEKLFYMDKHGPRLITYDFNHSVHNDSAYAVLQKPFLEPPIRNNKLIRVIGSCRGFLLLAQLNMYSIATKKKIDTMCMWNPTTRFRKFIPRPPTDAPNVGLKCDIYLRGFGYDPSTNDYLVVVNVCCYYQYDFPTRVYIFSVRENSWTQTEGTSIKSFKSPWLSDGGDYVGLYFNFALHWISSNVIVTFNLATRSFTEIPLPIELDIIDDYGCCGLRVFGDLLGVFARGDMEFNKYSVSIWVMGEYNNASSWRRSHYVRVYYDICSDNKFSYWRSMPMCCTQSGHLFVSDFTPHVMGKWDHNGNVEERRTGYEMPSVFESDVVIYRESLLSVQESGRRSNIEACN